MLGLDDEIAEPGTRRQHDLRGLGRLLAALRDQCVIGLQPRLALRLPRARALPDPFEFALQRAAARLLLPAFLREAGLLLFEPARVVALERDAVAAVEFEDPAGDLVEEIAIVRHRDDGAGIVLQKALQPCHRFGVEMVGRLVEQQQVRALQQQAAQRDAAALAAGQGRDRRIARRAAQRVHRDLDGAVEFPGVGLVDFFLQFALLGDQRIHLLGREVLGEAGADCLEAVEQ